MHARNHERVTSFPTVPSGMSQRTCHISTYRPYRNISNASTAPEKAQPPMMAPTVRTRSHARPLPGSMMGRRHAGWRMGPRAVDGPAARNDFMREA